MASSSSIKYALDDMESLASSSSVHFLLPRLERCPINSSIACTRLACSCINSVLDFAKSLVLCFPHCKMASSSSSVISCINSALGDVESLGSSFPDFHINRFPLEKPRYRLRNLKTFVLLAGKLENDVHLGSLLITIEEAVTRISREILHNLPGLEQEDFVAGYNFSNRVASDFQRDFESLKEGVDEWYIATSNNTRRSNSLTADEAGEISESIWENLVDLSRSFSRVLIEVLEPLREHLNFLKNLCRFATSRGVDHGQMKDFLAHTEAIAISAAHLCFLCGDGIEDEVLCGGDDIEDEVLCGDDIEDEEWLTGMQSKLSMLVQKIKPIDPQVCETYTKIISCSKLSTRIDAPTGDMDEDSTIVTKNFIDSFIAILWDMLRLDTCHVVCLKDNWQLLYEGLRSLRTILKKLQPNDIDEKIRDDIGDMVCDAGVLVCSFYHKKVEIDLGLQDLWERIKVFLGEDREEVPQTSKFNPSSINLRGFVDFSVENLMELTNGGVQPIVQSRVHSIQEGLLYLRTFLGEIEELRHEQEELQALWNRVLEMTYRVELLIDHLIAGDISDSFSVQFDSVMEEIQNIKTDASKSSYGKRRDTKVKEVSSSSSHVLPSQRMASLTTEVVGFHDEASSIKSRLQSGERGYKQRQVIAIVGMGGLGKTTLALKVYDDPAVKHYFSARARCTVSQTLDRKKLLFELLYQIDAEKCSEMTEDDLAEKLRKKLKGKRYLIFLDDVWTIEAWNSLQASFPDDLTGSRIILTTRNYDAVPVSMLGQDQSPLFLRQLSEKESLELMQRKLFPGEVWPPELDKLGMQIAEKCKGLPLTIVLLAGLLATKEQEGWKEIVDGLSWGDASITEQCMSSMEFSYQHLPDYLRPCFLYFGAFPEDHEVSVKRLIWLWIAEGFIRKSKLKSVKETAEDYMKDLIGRSLIIVDKRGSMGGFKTCRIHDLVREFCLEKAKGEHFLNLVEGYDELLAFNEPCNLRRLCIHSKPQHLKESKLFCPRVRSLLFFSQNGPSDSKEAWINIFLVHIFKFVSVLDLEPIHLGDVFPSEIELLVQLRYLAIRFGGDMSVIPSWIGKLSMLETFIVNACGDFVLLRDTIWNLQKLKYLYIRNGFGVLPPGNLDNNSVLYELDALGGVGFYCGPSMSMEEQKSKFPNIRKLKCFLHERDSDTEAFYNIGVADFPMRLESLNMRWRWSPADNIQLEFSFPTNLKKLTLEEFRLPWSKISTIGGLPNLEVLKLLSDSFRGGTWEMEEGELFPKLKYLKLSDLNLKSWRTASRDSDDQFPGIQKLVLTRCRYLEEMPCCFESRETLEMIDVEYCSEATRSLVERIEEQRVSLGNAALQITYR